MFFSTSTSYFHYIFRNRDPKDLLKARKNGPNFQTSKTTSTNVNTSTPTSYSNSSKTLKGPVTGKLHEALTRERTERNAITSCPGSRMNRFGGVFVVPSTVSVSTSTNSSSSNNSQGSGNGRISVPQIIRNPVALLNPELARPNIQKKRTRGSATFSKDSNNAVTKSSSFLSSAGAIIEQKAIYVLAEFLETFLSSGFRYY